VDGRDGFIASQKIIDIAHKIRKGMTDVENVLHFLILVTF